VLVFLKQPGIFVPFSLYESGLKRKSTRGLSPKSWNNSIVLLFSHEYPECLFSSISIISVCVSKSIITSGRLSEQPPSTLLSNTSSVSK